MSQPITLPSGNTISPELRVAGPESWEILLNLGRKTFIESFAAQNTEENLNNYLDQAFNRATLTQELTEPASQIYIAYYQAQPVGYLKLNIDRTPAALQPARALEIQRIYVLQAFQGQKIGNLFMQKAIDTARLHHLDYVWLGVWEHNPRAIAFYQRWGFEIFSSYIFTLGNEAQTDYLMRLKIR
jgi:diamine N-acetyltransferase